jgi:hypothetical protein
MREPLLDGLDVVLGLVLVQVMHGLSGQHGHLVCRSGPGPHLRSPLLRLTEDGRLVDRREAAVVEQLLARDPHVRDARAAAEVKQEGGQRGGG